MREYRGFDKKIKKKFKKNNGYLSKSVQGRTREMKQVTVSGAVILRTNPETNKKEIFATQRGYGDYKDGWEIPAGQPV